MTNPEPFSAELERWLATEGEKTLGDVQVVFGERTFAVLVLLLMTPTALPLPTGGVTVLFEAATVLLALEMIAGRRSVWLPSSWQRRRLGPVATEKAVPTVLRAVRWCERWSRPRGARVLEHGWVWRLLGAAIGVLAIVAAVAPPFSGLDTLPSVGVVLLAMAILLHDLVFVAAGLGVGAAGALLVLTLGAALARVIRTLW